MPLCYAAMLCFTIITRAGYAAMLCPLCYAILLSEQDMLLQREQQ
jgi:hypothetical protein